MLCKDSDVLVANASLRLHPTVEADAACPMSESPAIRARSRTLVAGGDMLVPQAKQERPELGRAAGGKNDMRKHS